jgi:hypothetical protein
MNVEVATHRHLAAVTYSKKQQCNNVNHSTVMLDRDRKYHGDKTS